jgi:hypothetical protein
VLAFCHLDVPKLVLEPSLTEQGNDAPRMLRKWEVVERIHVSCLLVFRGKLA